MSDAEVVPCPRCLNWNRANYFCGLCDSSHRHGRSEVPAELAAAYQLLADPHYDDRTLDRIATMLQDPSLLSERPATVLGCFARHVLKRG